MLNRSLNRSANIPGQLFTTQPPSKGVKNEDETIIIKNFEQIPADVYIMQIASSINNTFLLSTSGVLYSWGEINSVLGRTAFIPSEAIKPTPIIGLAKVVQIVAGTNHALLLDINGNVYSWGDNTLGQLGHGDQEECKIPKEIEQFKKDPVVQIYAGANSSYAITKKGNLFAWGDVLENKYDQNGNNQLGLQGKYLVEPRLLIHTPWDTSNIDMKIVYGKNNVGYIFKPDFTEQVKENNQDQKYKIQELETKILQLQSKVSDLESINYGKTTQQLAQALKQTNEDHLMKGIQQQQIIVATEIQTNEQQVKINNDEIDQLVKDLDSIKHQLIEISGKENNLISQRDVVDNAIRKEQRINKGVLSAQFEVMVKDQKRFKELLQANDNIKNTLIKKQNDLDVMRIKKMETLYKNQGHLNDLKNRQTLLIDFEFERKKTIKTAFLNENRADLDKVMSKVYNLYKMLLDTNVNEIAKRSGQIIGLEELISQSNTKLKQTNQRMNRSIKNDLQAFKINPNDGIYEIITRVLEIIQDNLHTKLRLNDYIGGLILQISLKNEDFVQSFKAQQDFNQTAVNSTRKKYTTITDYVMKQKKSLTDIGKQATNVKGYTKELKKFKVQETAKSRGCF